MRYILLIVLFIPSYSQADCDVTSCDYREEWSEFGHFITEYSRDESGESTKFEYIQSENELLIEVSSADSTTILFSINGVGTLYKNVGETGFKTTEECYSIVGDTYAIFQSYAVRTIYFIGIGSQLMPSTLEGKQEIKYEHIGSDSRVQINPGDHMIIGSPWYLSGSIESQDEILYKIHHEHTVNNELQGIFIQGSWSDQLTANGIGDDVSLNDWLICIGGRSSFSNGNYDFEPYITETSTIKYCRSVKDPNKSINYMPTASDAEKRRRLLRRYTALR